MPPIIKTGKLLKLFLGGSVENNMKLILTVPVHGDFREFASEPAIEGFRLNTTIPPKTTLEEVLESARDKANGKDVWIDLKTRQLRIKDYRVNILNDKEMHYITLSHKLEVNLPSQVFIDDGNFTGKIEEIINGDTLVIPSSTELKKGLPLMAQGEVGIRPSMSVNILDPSLRIKGFLTDRDKQYIEAAKKVGLHNYMISYVEEESDLIDLLMLDNRANIIAKIESKKGMEFIKNHYPKYKNVANLMAARGDLYVELEQPHQILDSLKKIIKADKNAIAASRIFSSLKDLDKLPACNDLTDLAYMREIGYKRFMLGDELCLNRDSVKSSIGLFKAIAGGYK